MVNIPRNTPRKSAAAKESGERDRFIKRILDSFKSGRASVNIGGGGRGVTESAARAIGRQFTEKGYFASLIYSVDGKFCGLSVSTSRLNNNYTSMTDPGEAKELTQPDLPDMDVDVAANIDEDVFSFNGEPVTVVSDPGKPYAIYRREYPHKPKWIVADASHRVVALLLWRSHAQAVVDELNKLSARVD